jgi:hypothetical protein
VLAKVVLVFVLAYALLLLVSTADMVATPLVRQDAQQHMCVCVCLRVCVCTYIFTYAHAGTCWHTFIYAHDSVYTYSPIQVHIAEELNMSPGVAGHTHAPTHILLHTHIHTHMHS